MPTFSRTIIIGSRGSELALWQANTMQQMLADVGIRSEIKIIKTQGDKIQNLSFDKLEGKGFFTKELEEELLAGTIDLAVHSHKDLPTQSPEGLVIAAVSDREDPSELLLVRKECVDLKNKYSVRSNAIMGTSSARRKVQLLAFRPDFEIIDIRGNVPTRIRKLKDGEYDAIMLAYAGVKRLGIDLSDFHAEVLSPDEFIPAPAQGVLALQTRSADEELIQALQQIHNPHVAEEIQAERALLRMFDGGCQLPLGAYCRKDGNTFLFHALKADNIETYPKRIVLESENASGLATQAFEKLKEKKSLSVFVTRELREDDYLQRLLESNGYQLSGESLIISHPIAFGSVPASDWILFSSKNGVNHFFEKHPALNPEVKIAVSGKGTLSTLRERGYDARFCAQSSDMAKEADAFRNMVGNETVLFPRAKNSLRTFQKAFSESKQIIDLPVYETEAVSDFIVPATDCVIFTSPSSARALLQWSSPPVFKYYIAMGKSTAAELNSLGIDNVLVAHSPDDAGLADAVFSI